MENKAIYHSPKLAQLKQEKKKKSKRKLFIFLSIFIVFIIGLIFLANWKEINIDNVNVTGNKIIESKEIEDIIHKNLSGKYLWLIPKTNGLLYPEDKILDELHNKYKRINTLEIDTNDFKTLDVTLTENIASYTWCGDTQVVDATEESCYFIDKDGYVFDKAPNFSGDVYYRFYGEIKKQNDSPIGFYFMPKIFNNLINFKQVLDNIKLETSSIFVKGKDTEISLKKNNNAKIIFKTNDDLIQIGQNIQSSVLTDPLKSRIEKEYDSLLYIDLRFDNKVYYKFK
ncbi:MAG: hypothetical protein M3P22_00935 [bacterium]|nr:hypothetical protein [bacterium]